MPQSQAKMARETEDAGADAGAAAVAGAADADAKGLADPDPLHWGGYTFGSWKREHAEWRGSGDLARSPSWFVASSNWGNARHQKEMEGCGGNGGPGVSAGGKLHYRKPWWAPGWSGTI